MRIVVVEFLQFGLARLAQASAELGAELVLFTADPGRYDYELGLPGAGAIRVVEVNCADIDAMDKAARELGDVAGVIGNTDPFATHAIDLADRLGLPHADRDAVALVRDKRRMRDLLHAKGLSPGAAIRLDPSTMDDPGLDGRFPLIVKDSAGLGSMNVWLVRDRAELAAAVAACDTTALLGSLYAEPVFLGPLFSAESVTWNHETTVLGITSRTLSREFRFREETLSFPVEFGASTRAGLADWISAVLRAVSFDRGFSHVEFILTGDGPQLVEINPRLGGIHVGESICTAYGINVYAAMAEIALGRRPGVLSDPLTPRCGFAQIMLYAPEPGRLVALRGAEAVQAFPGSPALLPTAPDGAVVETVADHRGLVAILTATGENAELAWHNADAAAAVVTAEMSGSVRRSRPGS